MSLLFSIFAILHAYDIQRLTFLKSLLCGRSCDISYKSKCTKCRISEEIYEFSFLRYEQGELDSTLIGDNSVRPVDLVDTDWQLLH